MLTGVSTLVLISVLVRPVALITYALLAFAAGISQADQSRS
ncbi:putative conserved membrane protein [Synechococcus sp. A15-127]|nr:putative conserved membrane protein [Synechococcus sp. A15-127]